MRLFDMPIQLFIRHVFIVFDLWDLGGLEPDLIKFLFVFTRFLIRLKFNFWINRTQDLNLLILKPTFNT